MRQTMSLTTTPAKKRKTAQIRCESLPCQNISARVTGEPVMPLDVTTTVAFPSPLKKDLQYLAETSVNFQT